MSSQILMSLFLLTLKFSILAGGYALPTPTFLLILRSNILRVGGYVLSFHDAYISVNLEV